MNKLFTLVTLFLLCSFLSTVKVSSAGSDMNSAQAITYSDTQNASLTFGEQEDWYRFTTSDKDAWTSIKVVSKSVQSLELFLYNKDGKEIEQITTYKNKENYISLKLQKACVYYIKAASSYYSGSTGDYVLSINEIIDDVSDDSENAKNLTIGKSFKGKMESQGDADWFQIKSGNADSWYKFKIINSNLTKGANLTLYDSNHVELYDWSAYHNGNTAGEDLKLDKNTIYYIKISSIPYYGESIGNYVVSVSEIKDDAGDSQETAARINISKTYKKKISVAGDTDYYKFKSGTTTRNYTITAKNTNINTYITITLFDQDGGRLDEFIIYRSGDIGKITNKLNKNKIYYLKVTSRGIGTYTFHVKITK